MKRLLLTLTLSLSASPLLALNEESIGTKKKVLISSGILSGVITSICLFSVFRNAGKMRQMSRAGRSLRDNKNNIECPSVIRSYNRYMRIHKEHLIVSTIAAICATVVMIQSALLYKDEDDKLKNSNKKQ